MKSEAMLWCLSSLSEVERGGKKVYWPEAMELSGPVGERREKKGEGGSCVQEGGLGIRKLHSKSKLFSVPSTQTSQTIWSRRPLVVAHRTPSAPGGRAALPRWRQETQSTKQEAQTGSLRS